MQELTLVRVIVLLEHSIPHDLEMFQWKSAPVMASRPKKRAAQQCRDNLSPRFHVCRALGQVADHSGISGDIVSAHVLLMVFDGILHSRCGSLEV